MTGNVLDDTVNLFNMGQNNYDSSISEFMSQRRESSECCEFILNYVGQIFSEEFFEVELLIIFDFDILCNNSYNLFGTGWYFIYRRFIFEIVLYQSQQGSFVQNKSNDLF